MIRIIHISLTIQYLDKLYEKIYINDTKQKRLKSFKTTTITKFVVEVMKTESKHDKKRRELIFSVGEQSTENFPGKQSLKNISR